MKSLTIRGIPEDVLARLRTQAARNHRSLNGEVLALLTRGTQEDAGRGIRAGNAVREPAVRYGADAPATEATPSFLDTVDRDALADVCQRYHIRWLAVFGSRARGSARPGSDVDVVVEFEDGKTPGLGFVRVADALRPLFGGVAVDLRTRRGLAPRLRDRILADAVELYAA